MIRFHNILAIHLLLSTAVLSQEPEAAGWSASVEQELVETISQNDLARKVYTEVVSRLRRNGVPPGFLRAVFSHREVRIDDEVVERFEHPAEQLPYKRYREIFITEERIQKGEAFYQQNLDLITSVADSFGVDPLLMVSIMGIESRYGENALSFPVFNALHTIIHKIHRKEAWAEKEMTAYLGFCYENFIPPLTLYGSYAGAFGYGQFIPSSFAHYAVDFDGDGVRHPFQWPDALASVANYLIRHGYHPKSNDFGQDSPNWRAILKYNPSENYVRVVLELRDELQAALSDEGQTGVD